MKLIKQINSFFYVRGSKLSWRYSDHLFPPWLTMPPNFFWRIHAVLWWIRDTE